MPKTVLHACAMYHSNAIRLFKGESASISERGASLVAVLVFLAGSWDRIHQPTNAIMAISELKLVSR